MKTYENFITDLFKKKLPVEVVNFGNVLSNFIRDNFIKYIDEDYVVYLKEVGNNNLSIYISPKGFDKFSEQVFRVISLDYDKKQDYILYLFVCKIRESDKDWLQLKLINDFFEKIILDFSKHQHSPDFFISFDKVQDIIDNINQADFDVFLMAKKYNI